MHEPQKNIYSISKLNHEVKNLLEEHYTNIWVQGEISNFVAHSSGHWYFSLKDLKAQISCAMFRGRNRLAKFKPESGNQIIARAKISLYEPRGNYQLILEHIEPAGEGLLRQQYEELKNKLESEGLFSTENKKRLPSFPKQIAIVSSPTGAAIRDILSVLKRRYPLAMVILYPSAVQGQGASTGIVKAIQQADHDKENEVLIIARGGGSIEDLWSFNEEIVARAIFTCQLPTISGIGHEIDFTIADFVADVRAPTPSAAAEAVTPDSTELTQDLSIYASRFTQLIQAKLNQINQTSDSLNIRLQQQHPINRIKQLKQRSHDTFARLQQFMQMNLQLQKSKLDTIKAQLTRHEPNQKLQQHQEKISTLHQRMHVAMKYLLSHNKQNLVALSRALDTVSPLGTLDRGYAIMTAKTSGVVINDIKKINVGDQISAQISDGKFDCEIKKIYTNHANRGNKPAKEE